MEENDIGIV